MNELVSKEIAILAKQKGFDEICLNHFGDDEEFQDDVKNSELEPYEYSRPTRTQLQNHLRERGVEVWAAPYENRACTKIDGSYSGFVYRNNLWFSSSANKPTFQEAFDWALMEGLKHYNYEH